MKTKITNAYIIKDFDSDIIFGDIVVEDDKIAYVGSQTDTSADKVIDAGKNLVMPGFVNCNTKASSVVFKGLLTEKKLDDKLYQQKKYEKKLKPIDFYNASVLSCFEYAKNGITTVFENYVLPDQSAKAFCDCGIRAVVGLSQRYSSEKFLSETELEKLAEKIKQMGKTVSVAFYCDNTNNCDEDMFNLVQKLALKNNSFSATSASTTLDEVGRCATLNNDMSPVELLEDYGFFDHKSLVMHATNITERDVQILAKNSVCVCANISSDYSSSNGTMPVYQLKNHGVDVCIGTDFASITGKQDMFREMFLVLSSQNNLLGGRELIARDILKMATINGAKALGLDDVGRIDVGYFADLIIIDLHNVNNAIKNNIFENLIISSGSEDIVMTMSDGKVIYQNGKHFFSKSKNSVFAKTKDIQERLKQ